MFILSPIKKNRRRKLPLYEYECDSCMESYNTDIDSLVDKLTKKNATEIFKKNSNFCYIEVTRDKDGKRIFELGEKGVSGARRFRYKLQTGKVLYLELKNFRFNHLVYGDDDREEIKCPLCDDTKTVRRVFSTFKAIFDDKSKRAPGPGDELRWHLEYKQQKDEEIASDWVGQDHLGQYFNR